MQGKYLPAQDELVHEAVAGHEAEHAVRHHLAHLQNGMADGVLHLASGPSLPFLQPMYLLWCTLQFVIHAMRHANTIFRQVCSEKSIVVATAQDLPT